MDADHTLLLQHFSNLAIALALGLLIGSERGWHERERSKGRRVAGVRTFSLLALLGGAIASAVTDLPEYQRWLICALVFLPVSAMLIAGYCWSVLKDDDVGLTTEVAAMLTFWLGVLPAFGYALPAAATAVVVALLLHLKSQIHRVLAAMNQQELVGTLQFLLVSLVVLPLLPDENFGPWGALNPYHLWWMVVLISGLSLIGYFANRLFGQRKGILITALAGGLASSTALTLSLSRMQKDINNAPMLACGILLACAAMFLRVLVVVLVLKRELLPGLLPALLLACACLLVPAWWYWRHSKKAPATSQEFTVKNPFQLIPALQFGLLLALVMVGSEALQEWLGNAGLYLLSLVTGITDVDAIVLSLGPRAGDSLPLQLVVLCIALAAGSNTFMKAVYCRWIGGAELGWKVMLPALAAIAVLFPTLWVTRYVSG